MKCYQFFKYLIMLFHHHLHSHTYIQPTHNPELDKQRKTDGWMFCFVF